MEVERKADGTFAPGVSGNPNGRPKKQPQRLRMPAKLRNVVFEVAEAPVKVKLSDGDMEVSSYRAVMLALRNEALKGKVGAQRAFLAELEKASAVHGQQTELVTFFASEAERLEKELDYYRSLMPEIDGGVCIQLPEGRVVPAAAYRATMGDKG